MYIYIFYHSVVEESVSQAVGVIEPFIVVGGNQHS